MIHHIRYQYGPPNSMGIVRPFVESADSNDDNRPPPTISATDGGEKKRTRPSDGSEFRGTGGGTWGRLDVDSKDESTSHWKIIASSADINRGISSSRERRWGENAGRCCCPSIRQGPPPTHPTPSPARGRGGTEENSDAAQKPIGSTNVIRGEGLERCRTSSPQIEVCGTFYIHAHAMHL